MTSSRFFNGTCEVFDLRNCTGEVLNKLFIDPCSCLNFYQCGNDYNMLHRNCSEGTAFNYQNEMCDRSTTVFNNQDCDKYTNVWNRCNVSDTRKKQLKQQCTNSPTTTLLPETTTKPPVRSASSSDDINPGIIIGAVIAGAVLTAVIVIAIVLYRRRQKAKILKKRSTIANNPEYFEGGNPDDPYAIINDAHVAHTQMHDPSFMGTVNRNGTLQSNMNMGFEEDVEYDNTNVQIVNDYTSSQRTAADNITNTSADQTNNPKRDYYEIYKKNETTDYSVPLGTSVSSRQSSSSHAEKSTLSSTLSDPDEQHDYFELQQEPNCGN